jgi:PAS domain S-box-containing protein
VAAKGDKDELLASPPRQKGNRIPAARRRAERRSEAYFAEAQRLSHTGSFGWQPSTGEIIWSEETFRIFQYDTNTTPTVELLLQRVHPEDAAFVEQTIERAAQDAKDFDHEYRLVMQDGSVKYVHVVAHALGDRSDGIEFVGAVMDVTAVRRTEEALRRSENYLAEAQKLTHTGSGAWRVAERDALYLSEEWYRIYGFDPEEGLSAWEKRLQRMHPEDRGPWREITDRAIRERSDYEGEHRILLPDGTVKYTHTVGHPVLSASGDVEQFVCTMMDITERKQAEEALRQSEAYLAEAQRLSHTGSWAWNIGAKRLFWSVETFQLFGFDPNTKTATPETFLGRVHPDDRGSIEVVETELYKGNDAEYSYRIILPDGSIKYITSVAHPILNDSGQVIEFVGTVIDVTERKKAEEAREALRETQAALARVSRVNTMGELTASLAHEVNQPIAAASTNANTCLRWLAADTPNIEEAREAAMRIVTDVKRAGEIISRIRQLFQKGSSEREFVDINEIIREMIFLLRGETTRYNIVVRTDLAADLPRVMADRVQLQQVLMNLMINSVEAMKGVDGPRELSIKLQSAKDAQLMLSVSDTGVGLPQHQADQIFHPFFTTKGDGTGMGLRISRSIIESHGGRLWAADNSPRGASFCFTLPHQG